ncbi:MAG: transglycosylase SLT domain-containing protein [Deltaproteobacteria bacterium]|jgi:soluble lytic murein transglycosylase|nr:transglycosylase SLT domain-containing protein [Deltaproteobacteria bacterium]
MIRPRIAAATVAGILMAGVICAQAWAGWRTGRGGVDGGAAPAELGAEAPPAPASAVLGPGFMEPTMPYSGALAAALARRDHDEAAKLLVAFDKQRLRGAQIRNHAFVTAWTLIRAGRTQEAVGLTDLVEQAEDAPPDHRALVVAELKLAAGDANGAVAALNQLSGGTRAAVRAELLRANAQIKLGGTKAASDIWEALVTRPDPSEGSDQALLALAQRKGMGSKEAYALLRRLWSRYPRTGPGKEADRLLTANYPGRGPTDLELALRGEAIMDAGDFGAAITLLQPLVARIDQADEAACIAWYTVGRSQFKKNNVSAAAAMLVPAGQRCASIDKDRGARALYVAGMAHERKKEWTLAGQAFGLIPALYAGHNMADDGYARGGIAWQQAGEPARAIDMWERQVKEYPQGDLTAEAWWRLAWNAYLAGDARTAIRHADALVENIDPVGDPVHYYAGRYWRGRWRLYPDYAEPTRLSTSSADRTEGIALLLALCAEAPTQFYSLLASSRLSELAPERTAQVERPAPVGSPGTWTVRETFVQHPSISAGVALMRLGLVGDALHELEGFPKAELSPSEFALINEVRALKEPLVAHDALHKYLLERPASTLGPDRDRILRQAYPNTWWPEVQVAAGGYTKRMDPRVFHALVREESSFNPNATSWAGAKGLSQLMPATARHVAGKMGISLGSNGILDPKKNLAIGAYYLDYLHGYFNGNPFLAVPAYNAGEGNVGHWAKTWGARPTDEFVEAIPIRETRHYVKRVLGTYQLYRVMWSDGAVFPDWSPYNHKAWKK